MGSMAGKWQYPHRRWNPLRQAWVLVSPHRTQRPWQGEVAQKSAPSGVTYDPECYLCPGNKRAGGAANPQYDSIFTFVNDYAALLPDLPVQQDEPSSSLLVAEAARGLCKVLCFHPDHSLTLARMTRPEIRRVVDAWAREYEELGATEWIGYVQIFENRGAMMGASNPHPHCQAWATASIPEAPAKELAAQRAYRNSHQACLLCDYLGLEQRERVRLVCENDGFVAVVPFWAIWPFEILVCSRRHYGSMNEFAAKEAHHLSQILQRVTSTYDKVFEVPFPYSMGFHQSPTDELDHPECHFHAHFYPPLLRSGTIRKFMVGFEMLGTPQRDITAEIAAERLRELADAQP
jgi:UDPglucose--hexose-1-phosphate uridylyltransferase